MLHRILRQSQDERFNQYIPFVVSLSNHPADKRYFKGSWHGVRRPDIT
jgi:hypothetical protein